MRRPRTTITWSGYARAGSGLQLRLGRRRERFADRSIVRGWTAVRWEDDVTHLDRRSGLAQILIDSNAVQLGGSYGDDDVDVKARGQLRVNASTDTAVGEVGVDIRLRANFDGNGAGDVYSDVAWGYWAMTPELTFGGGYAGSLGNVGYGYDGACTCYYTDNADVAFNPGDTTPAPSVLRSGSLLHGRRPGRRVDLRYDGFVGDRQRRHQLATSSALPVKSSMLATCSPARSRVSIARR